MPNTDLQQINARNEQARHIVACCASAMPTLASMWRHLDAALADAATLAAHVGQLAAELDRARFERANLRAAMRATLTAYADGEPDPLWDPLSATR